MLAAIREATRSINMELYIFQPGRIANQFVAELSAKARQGVTVTIVVDALGSLSLWGRPVRRLRNAGCRIESYQRLRWYSLARLNNRTHRELLVVDGSVAFAGGAGIADWWVYPTFKRMRRRKPWRDTMARIEGPVVAAVQGVAAENWLECCGEILTGPAYFPSLRHVGDTTAFVVKSSPADRATASRVTFQTLMEGVGALDSHLHAVFPAGSIASTGAHRDRAPRRQDYRGRARPKDRSAVGAPREPPDVGTAARGRHPHLRIPPDHDPRQGARGRRALVRARDHEHRQPIVRAQRRGQPGDARSSRRGTAAAKTTSATSRTATR